MSLAGQGPQGRKLRAQKRTLGGLTLASTAHGIKGSVEAMMNLVYLLQHSLNLDEQTRELVHQLDNELQRMRHTISQTLGDFREPADPTLVSLPDMLDTILRFHSHKIVFKQIGIDKRYECDAVVKAYSEDLRQVFSNLVVNALEALRLRGRLTVHIYHSHDWNHTEPAGVRVIIADNGSGILPEYQGKVFQHAFTTKGGKGTGLGLRISAEIVRKHGGSIRFRSSTKPGRSGTVFSVFFPAPAATKLKFAA